MVKPTTTTKKKRVAVAVVVVSSSLVVAMIHPTCVAFVVPQVHPSHQRIREWRRQPTTRSPFRIRSRISSRKRPRPVSWSRTSSSSLNDDDDEGDNNEDQRNEDNNNKDNQATLVRVLTGAMMLSMAAHPIVAGAATIPGLEGIVNIPFNPDPSSLEVALATFGHYFGMLSVVGILMYERLSIEPYMDTEKENKFNLVDKLFTLAILGVTYTGYLKGDVAYSGQGWEYYVQDQPLFWIKMFLFAIFVSTNAYTSTILSRRAVQRLLGNRQDPILDEDVTNRIKQSLNLQLAEITLFPLISSSLSQTAHGGSIVISDVDIELLMSNIPWQIEAAIDAIVFLGFSSKNIGEGLGIDTDDAFSNQTPMRRSGGGTGNGNQQQWQPQWPQQWPQWPGQQQQQQQQQGQQQQQPQGNLNSNDIDELFGPTQTRRRPTKYNIINNDNPFAPMSSSPSSATNNDDGFPEWHNNENNYKTYNNNDFQQQQQQKPQQQQQEQQQNRDTKRSFFNKLQGKKGEAAAGQLPAPKKKKKKSFFENLFKKGDKDEKRGNTNGGGSGGGVYNMAATQQQQQQRVSGFQNQQQPQPQQQQGDFNNNNGNNPMQQQQQQRPQQSQFNIGGIQPNPMVNQPFPQSSPSQPATSFPGKTDAKQGFNVLSTPPTSPKKDGDENVGRADGIKDANGETLMSLMDGTSTAPPEKLSDTTGFRPQPPPTSSLLQNSTTTPTSPGNDSFPPQQRQQNSSSFSPSKIVPTKSSDVGQQQQQQSPFGQKPKAGSPFGFPSSSGVGASGGSMSSPFGTSNSTNIPKSAPKTAAASNPFGGFGGPNKATKASSGNPVSSFSPSKSTDSSTESSSKGNASGDNGSKDGSAPASFGGTGSSTGTSKFPGSPFGPGSSASSQGINPSDPKEDDKKLPAPPKFGGSSKAEVKSIPFGSAKRPPPEGGSTIPSFGSIPKPQTAGSTKNPFDSATPSSPFSSGSVAQSFSSSSTSSGEQTQNKSADTESKDASAPGSISNPTEAKFPPSSPFRPSGGGSFSKPAAFGGTSSMKTEGADQKSSKSEKKDEPKTSPFGSTESTLPFGGAAGTSKPPTPGTSSSPFGSGSTPPFGTEKDAPKGPTPGTVSPFGSGPTPSFGAGGSKPPTPGTANPFGAGPTPPFGTDALKPQAPGANNPFGSFGSNKPEAGNVIGTGKNAPANEKATPAAPPGSPPTIGADASPPPFGGNKATSEAQATGTKSSFGPFGSNDKPKAPAGNPFSSGFGLKSTSASIDDKATKESPMETESEGSASQASSSGANSSPAFGKGSSPAKAPFGVTASTNSQGKNGTTPSFGARISPPPGSNPLRSNNAQPGNSTSSDGFGQDQNFGSPVNSKVTKEGKETTPFGAPRLAGVGTPPAFGASTPNPGAAGSASPFGTPGSHSTQSTNSTTPSFGSLSPGSMPTSGVSTPKTGAVGPTTPFGTPFSNTAQSTNSSAPSFGSSPKGNVSSLGAGASKPLAPGMSTQFGKNTAQSGNTPPNTSSTGPAQATNFPAIQKPDGGPNNGTGTTLFGPGLDGGGSSSPLGGSSGPGIGGSNAATEGSSPFGSSSPGASSPMGGNPGSLGGGPSPPIGSGGLGGGIGSTPPSPGLGGFPGSSNPSATPPATTSAGASPIPNLQSSPFEVSDVANPFASNPLATGPNNPDPASTNSGSSPDANSSPPFALGGPPNTSGSSVSEAGGNLATSFKQNNMNPGNANPSFAAQGAAGSGPPPQSSFGPRTPRSLPGSSDDKPSVKPQSSLFGTPSNNANPALNIDALMSVEDPAELPNTNSNDPNLRRSFTNASEDKNLMKVLADDEPLPFENSSPGQNNMPQTPNAGMASLGQNSFPQNPNAGMASLGQNNMPQNPNPGIAMSSKDGFQRFDGRGDGLILSVSDDVLPERTTSEANGMQGPQMKGYVPQALRGELGPKKDSTSKFDGLITIEAGLEAPLPYEQIISNQAAGQSTPVSNGYQQRKTTPSTSYVGGNTVSQPQMSGYVPQALRGENEPKSGGTSSDGYNGASGANEDLVFRVLYTEWCQQYGKEFDEGRLGIFASNMKRAEEYTKATGKVIKQIEYADLTKEEYEAKMAARKRSINPDDPKIKLGRRAMGKSSRTKLNPDDPINGIGESLAGKTTTDSTGAVVKEVLGDFEDSESKIFRILYSEWCEQYGKVFDESRLDIFTSNMKKIERYNIETGKIPRLIEYADLSKDEYEAKMSDGPKPISRPRSEHVQPPKTTNAPDAELVPPFAEGGSFGSKSFNNTISAVGGDSSLPQTNEASTSANSLGSTQDPPFSSSGSVSSKLQQVLGDDNKSKAKTSGVDSSTPAVPGGNLGPSFSPNKDNSDVKGSIPFQSPSSSQKGEADTKLGDDKTSSPPFGAAPTILPGATFTPPPAASGNSETSSNSASSSIPGPSAGKFVPPFSPTGPLGPKNIDKTKSTFTPPSAASGNSETSSNSASSSIPAPSAGKFVPPFSPTGPMGPRNMDNTKSSLGGDKTTGVKFSPPFATTGAGNSSPTQESTASETPGGKFVPPFSQNKEEAQAKSSGNPSGKFTSPFSPQGGGSFGPGGINTVPPKKSSGPEIGKKSVETKFPPTMSSGDSFFEKSRPGMISNQSIPTPKYDAAEKGDTRKEDHVSQNQRADLQGGTKFRGPPFGTTESSGTSSETTSEKLSTPVSGGGTFAAPSSSSTPKPLYSLNDDKDGGSGSTPSKPSILDSGISTANLASSSGSDEGNSTDNPKPTPLITSSEGGGDESSAPTSNGKSLLDAVIKTSSYSSPKQQPQPLKKNGSTAPGKRDEIPDRVLETYKNWCSHYGKEFNPQRLRVFADNFMRIEQYYTKTGIAVDMNQYADLTPDEYKEKSP